MSKKFKFAALSHIGLVRHGNEDNYGFIEFSQDFPFVAIVADGMGGHLNGELASKVAVEYVQDKLSKDLPLEIDSENILHILNDVIQKANIKVYLQSLESPKNRGMGTTLTIAVFYEDSVYIAHIGDSRCFLLRNHYLETLTKDHTVVEKMIEAGTISPVEIHKHPQRHVLTQALGSPEYLQPDLLHIDLRKRDRFLLSSDGLHGYVEDKEIENILMHSNDPEETCQELVNQALEKGGKDNITVLNLFFD
ncbi:MAG: Stp1/IreP family PP2C-type Ser/Thr phosphatase [Clostridiaceae bacterium]|nr:Stp1/IreP family PP2C-type Ser/Thr phosphatase [Clostridiaceae bacterium]